MTAKPVVDILKKRKKKEKNLVALLEAKKGKEKYSFIIIII